MRDRNWMGMAMALLALAHFGCGAANPVDKCNALVASTCKKYFECGASFGFSSEAECETQTRIQLECASWTLPEGCTYDWSQFDACLSDLDAESCSVAQSGQQPTSCRGATLIQPTCSSSSGIFCGDHESIGTGNGCSKTHAECQDGNTYTLSCEGSTCRCEVNGQMTQAAATTTCTSDEATLNQLCGWNLAVRR